MRMIITAVVTTLATGVMAQPPTLGEANEKMCILEAAKHLPRISGLAVVEGRTKPLPAHIEQPSTGVMIEVQIDISAAGQQATYSFLCGVIPGKPVMVRSVGLVR